jgi:CubicO group peptidase (beta-lactamase class C family)
MQTFGRPGGYGLGLDRLGRGVAGGLRAVGHGGGNIGTSAYMVYLPDHDVSIAVMVNRFGGDCASRIVRDVARTAVWHLEPGAFFELWGRETLLAGLWLAIAAFGLAWLLRRRVGRRPA